MTPKEINEAVARKLGDWELVPAQSGSDSYWRRPAKRDEQGRVIRPAEFPFLPSYSTDIKAAWEIVENHAEIQFNGTKQFFLTKNNLGQWLCGWVKRYAWGDFDSAFEKVADTAPMAICLAFLKLED